MININIEDLKHLLRNFDKISTDGISEIMQEILSQTPWIGWEIGPHLDGRIYCALTCGGDKTCLQEISDTLKLPLSESNWIIIAGSPPKEWDRYFEIHEGQDFIGVDASAWVWNVNKLGKIEFILSGINSNICKETALKLFLIGEIGEREYCFLKKKFMVSRKKTHKNWFNIKKLKPFLVSDLKIS